MKITSTGATLVLLSTLMLVPLAHASTSTTVSGTIVGPTSFTVTSTRSVGRNTIITANSAFLNTGDISGPSTCVEIVIIHADFSGNFHGICTNTVSVLGSPTGTFLDYFSGTFDTNGLDVGRYTIIQGTGSLAGIHGVINFHTPTIGSPFDIYSGQVHFDRS